MRCTQRGCELPQDFEHAHGALCPVCNNPQNRPDLVEAARIEAERIEAERLAAEVSQAKPLGGDGLPIPAVARSEDGEDRDPVQDF